MIKLSFDGKYLTFMNDNSDKQYIRRLRYTNLSEFERLMIEYISSLDTVVEEGVSEWAMEASGLRIPESKLPKGLEIKDDTIIIGDKNKLLQLISSSDITVNGNKIVFSQKTEDGHQLIILGNQDSLKGTLTTGEISELIYIDGNDKLQIGSDKAQTNINSSGDVTINGDKVVATTDNVIGVNDKVQLKCNL